jgi:hypothetical protein
LPVRATFVERLPLIIGSRSGRGCASTLNMLR